MNLLITGANGFIGTNLVNTLRLDAKYKLFFISRYNKNIFPFTPENIDFVIHLSSAHRLEPESLVYYENKKINDHLIDVLNYHNLKSNILFTSSIHEERDSFYGKSKKDGSIYLKTICDNWDKKFVKMVFPNIFGPYAKPYHTSVVSNFCNDIISNKKSRINNVDIDFIYIDQVIKAILNFKSENNFKTIKINLTDLHRRIENLHKQYIFKSKIVLQDTLDVKLFNTLKSYIN